MKIVVVVRTRDEEKNISTFCKCYSWADLILVADGGSVDKTTEIAEDFPNVKVRHYMERVSNDGFETWRNPHGKHMNFMFDWAEQERADWIIFDDADCFPTLDAQIGIRPILEKTSKNCVYINRVYTYHSDSWIKDITLPKDGRRRPTWENSSGVYAWKPGVVRARDEDWKHELDFFDAHIHYLLPPVSAIHDFYPEDGSRQKKVQFYKDTKEQEFCNDPLDVYNDIQPLEDWMVYK
jgi:glycosyltransferase involved in cell wall biosynthesis